MKSVFSKLIITGLLLFFILPVFTAEAQRGFNIKVKIKATENANAPVLEEVDLYGESHALVIGIDKYTQGWPILSEAVNDAKLVADELRKKGFNVTFKKNLGSDDGGGPQRLGQLRGALSYSQKLKINQTSGCLGERMG